MIEEVIYNGGKLTARRVDLSRGGADAAGRDGDLRGEGTPAITGSLKSARRPETTAAPASTALPPIKGCEFARLRRKSSAMLRRRGEAGPARGVRKFERSSLKIDPPPAAASAALSATSASRRDADTEKGCS